MQNNYYIRVGGILTQQQIEELFDKIASDFVTQHKKIYCNSMLDGLSWFIENGKITGYDTEENFRKNKYSNYLPADLTPFLKLIEKEKRSLFHPVYETYTEEANSIDREVTRALRPLIEKYSKEYKMNELELIFLCAVNLEFALQRMTRNLDIKRKERERTNSGS